MIRNKNYKNKYLKIADSEVIYPYDISEYIYYKTREETTYDFDFEETVENLASSSIYIVLQSEPPTINYNQEIEEVEPIPSGSVYIQNWVTSSAAPEVVQETIRLEWDNVRYKRQDLLQKSDWTQYQDSPITGSKLVEWQTYRQSLRDVTNQENPFNVIWPTKPE